MDEKTIKFLLNHRNPAKYATAFENPDEHFPEPLLTFYEPKIFPILQEAVNQGKKSPMKILQNLDILLHIFYVYSNFLMYSLVRNPLIIFHN